MQNRPVGGEGLSRIPLIERVRFHLRRLVRRVVWSVPSSDTKRRRILEIAKRYECAVFLETGTFVGDTVAYMMPHFSSIVSIELGHELAQRAQRRFSDQPSVRIVEGDSGEVLAHLVPTLDTRAFFWLDGHYSHSCTVNGETLQTALGAEATPILKELGAILSDTRFDHVIVIDDARLFTGEDQYPKRSELKRVVDSYRRRYEIKRADDMILILPLESLAQESARIPARA